MGRDPTQGSNLDSYCRRNAVKIWVDHALTDETEQYLGADGWPLGSGIFETVRTESSRPQLLSRHMRRVLLSARHLGLSLPNEDQILDAIEHVISAEPHPVGRLRLSFSSDHFVATHEAYLSTASHLIVGIYRRSGSTSERQHKVFPYTHHLDLLAKAAEQGVDEFICVDELGRVTEGAVSNIALQIAGQWITPPITSGILPGVIRALAIERCDFLVREISENDLMSCDGAIAMSSLKIALPIASIDARPIEIDSDSEQMCLKLRELARTL
jgi:branched-chain amino acid aminotransferase